MDHLQLATLSEIQHKTASYGSGAKPYPVYTTTAAPETTTGKKVYTTKDCYKK